jgi:hypothetical protein
MVLLPTQKVSGENRIAAERENKKQWVPRQAIRIRNSECPFDALSLAQGI